MEIVVTQDIVRRDKLIADFEPETSGLSKGQVVWIGTDGVADKASCVPTRRK